MKKLLVLLAVLLLVGNAMAVLPLEPKECREVELVKSELRADVEFQEFKYIAWPGLLGAGACGFGSGFTDFYTDYGITSSLAGFYDYDKADPKIYAIYAFDLDGRDQEKKICPFEEDCDFIRDCVDIQINGKTYWRLEHDNFKTGDKTDIFWSGYGLTAADESQGWSFGLNDVYNDCVKSDVPEADSKLRLGVSGDEEDDIGLLVDWLGVMIEDEKMAKAIEGGSAGASVATGTGAKKPAAAPKKSVPKKAPAELTVNIPYSRATIDLDWELGLDDFVLASYDKTELKKGESLIVRTTSDDFGKTDELGDVYYTIEVAVKEFSDDQLVLEYLLPADKDKAFSPWVQPKAVKTKTINLKDKRNIFVETGLKESLGDFGIILDKVVVDKTNKIFGVHGVTVDNSPALVAFYGMRTLKPERRVLKAYPPGKKGTPAKPGEPPKTTDTVASKQAEVAEGEAGNYYFRLTAEEIEAFTKNDIPFSYALLADTYLKVESPSGVAIADVLVDGKPTLVLRGVKKDMTVTLSFQNVKDKAGKEYFLPDVPITLGDDDKIYKSE